MNKLLIKTAMLGGLASASVAALAEEKNPPAPVAATPAPAPSQQASAADPGWGAPLKPSQLAGASGRADTTTAISDARLKATVTNNTATNVSSGNNTIDSGSFANMSGLPMVIQNSGANVLIQNATVINLQLR